MRDLIRLLLQFSMIVILVAGCVHNICHFEKLVDNPQHHSNQYNNYYDNSYYRTNSSTRQAEVEEGEPIEEIEEVTVTPNDAYYGY